MLHLRCSSCDSGMPHLPRRPCFSAPAAAPSLRLFSAPQQQRQSHVLPASDPSPPSFQLQPWVGPSAAHMLSDTNPVASLTAGPFCRISLSECYSHLLPAQATTGVFHSLCLPTGTTKIQGPPKSYQAVSPFPQISHHNYTFSPGPLQDPPPTGLPASVTSSPMAPSQGPAACLGPGQMSTSCPWAFARVLAPPRAGLPTVLPSQLPHFFQCWLECVSLERPPSLSRTITVTAANT